MELLLKILCWVKLTFGAAVDVTTRWRMSWQLEIWYFCDENWIKKNEWEIKKFLIKSSLKIISHCDKYKRIHECNISIRKIHQIFPCVYIRPDFCRISNINILIYGPIKYNSFSIKDKRMQFFVIILLEKGNITSI